ncbi:MAG: DUF2516 family protein [Corynebacterium sp.]|nr:DUF2516 family protein [Corynebacterium sp.]
MDLSLLMTATGLIIRGLYWLIAIFAFIGAFMVATTREDAFEVAGRQSKLIWTAMLGVSGFALLLGLPFLTWVGMVIVGLYWWDVRPQIKNILSGNGGW